MNKKNYSSPASACIADSLVCENVIAVSYGNSGQAGYYSSDDDIVIPGSY